MSRFGFLCGVKHPKLSGKHARISMCLPFISFAMLFFSKQREEQHREYSFWKWTDKVKVLKSLRFQDFLWYECR